MLGSLSEEQFKQLARYLSYPRGVTVKDQESYNTYLRARRVNQLMREVGKNNLDLLGMDLSHVKNWFAGNLSGNAGRYLKTSSLIVTFNDLLTTGGHNLSSRISRVKTMTNYKQSRGGYTPTDYERPVEPAATDDAPSTTKPSGNKPAAKPAGKSSGKNNSVKSKSPAHNKPATSTSQTTKNSGNKSSVRPRSTVISSAPRKKRGL